MPLARTAACVLLATIAVSAVARPPERDVDPASARFADTTSPNEAGVASVRVSFDAREPHVVAFDAAQVQEAEAGRVYVNYIDWASVVLAQDGGALRVSIQLGGKRGGQTTYTLEAPGWQGATGPSMLVVPLPVAQAGACVTRLVTSEGMPGKYGRWVGSDVRLEVCR